MADDFNDRIRHWKCSEPVTKEELIARLERLPDGSTMEINRDMISARTPKGGMIFLDEVKIHKIPDLTPRK